MSADADVLVIGGGIAGWSAAEHAARAGRAVVVVDARRHRASDLPVALVNPLRGHTGRLVARGIDGMHATFATIDRLRDAGHPIAAARGLYRPLIDVGPDASRPAYWATHLAGRLAFDWHASAPMALGLAERVPALHLRDAGWVAASDLLAALRRASAATIVDDRVVALVPDHRGGGTAHLASGTRLVAKTILWCGGAWGAAQLADAADAGASYKPGSLIAADAALTGEALSFGVYAVPWVSGDRATTLVGPTRERGSSTFPDGPVPDDVVAQLADRIGRVFATTASMHAVWRGVRLARLAPSASASLSGIATLTALGSRGFLMAPLLAAEWARSL